MQQPDAVRVCSRLFERVTEVILEAGRLELRIEGDRAEVFRLAPEARVVLAPFAEDARRAALRERLGVKQPRPG